VSPSAVLLHRTLLDAVGVFDESLPACEDYDLWLRVGCRYPIGWWKNRWSLSAEGIPISCLLQLGCWIVIAFGPW